MIEKISTEKYEAIVAKRLHQSREKVALAVSIYGRDYKKIKVFLYRQYEPELIPFIAKILNVREELAELAHSCYGYDLKKMISFTARYEYGLCTAC